MVVDLPHPHRTCHSLWHLIVHIVTELLPFPCILFTLCFIVSDIDLYLTCRVDIGFISCRTPLLPHNSVLPYSLRTFVNDVHFVCVLLIF